MTEPSLVELACSLSRSAFSDLHPYPLLVSVTGTELKQLEKRNVGTLVETPRVVMEKASEEGDAEDFPTVLATYHAEETPAEEDFIAQIDNELVVLPVRKSTRVFPNRISVGRTRSTNDIVIDDARISKLHAYFELTPEGAELYDAGSRNGTWVGGKKLYPHGAPCPVFPGDLVGFAGLWFSFLTAWEAAERIRALRGAP